MAAHCTCGLHYTFEQFRTLPLHNVERLGDGDAVEIRECVCGRLLRVTIDRDGQPQQPNTGDDDD